jgi:hypothetical protein
LQMGPAMPVAAHPGCCPAWLITATRVLCQQLLSSAAIAAAVSCLAIRETWRVLGCMRVCVCERLFGLLACARLCVLLCCRTSTAASTCSITTVSHTYRIEFEFESHMSVECRLTQCFLSCLAGVRAGSKIDLVGRQLTNLRMAGCCGLWFAVRCLERQSVLHVHAGQ